MMTILTSRLALAGLALAGGLAVAAGPAAAQGISANSTARAPGGVSGSDNQQSIKGMTQAPTVTLYGTPVVVNSPVMPPYNADSTYTTYQGQPASGPSAMLAATVQGAP